MEIYNLPKSPEPPVRVRRAIALESRGISAELQNAGVNLESRAYAPLQPEGSPYNLARGDRVTLIGHVANADGIHEARREAIDVGLTDLALLADGGADPDRRLAAAAPAITEGLPRNEG